jgi:hypothetical protein
MYVLLTTLQPERKAKKNENKTKQNNKTKRLRNLNKLLHMGGCNESENGTKHPAEMTFAERTQNAVTDVEG